MTSHRDAITGQYVTDEHAKTNPDTTVSEARTRRPAATGWQDALVVRDRLGQLRHAGGFLDEPIAAGLDPLEVAAFAGTFGPMEPILGRAGLPVVTTVCDLTARHIGKRVRVAGLTGRLLSIADGAWEGPNLVALAVVIRVTDMRTRDVLVGVNAECEVLP